MGGSDIVLSEEETECEGEMSGVEEMVAEGGVLVKLKKSMTMSIL